MSEQFNYVIAAPWPKGVGGLCTFSSFGEVHFGDSDDAQNSLDYAIQQIEKDVERYDHQPKAQDFKIYKVVSI